MLSFTPIRYPGGKTQLYKFVSELIRINFSTPPVYIEPFAGGAGLAIKLLIKGDVSKIYLNDLDKSIYSFWYSIFNYTEKFVEKIVNTEITIKEWYIQKKIYEQSESISILERGFATFFLNRTNRSGIIQAGPIGGKNQLGKYKIDCRFKKDKLINTIRRIASLKEKIQISNLDANNFVKNIDSIKTNALIYLDPPYVEKGNELYKNSLNIENHKSLYYTVSELKNKWFVTYDNHPIIHELYKDFNPRLFTINYSVQTKKKAKEVAIFCKKFKQIPTLKE